MCECASVHYLNQILISQYSVLRIVLATHRLRARALRLALALAVPIKVVAVPALLVRSALARPRVRLAESALEAPPAERSIVLAVGRHSVDLHVARDGEGRGLGVGEVANDLTRRAARHTRRAMQAR